MMKFNLTCCHVKFDVTKKNNNNLVGSYLKYPYNHDFLEETSRLYHIRSLTRLKLRIYFKHALCHIPDRLSSAKIGFDQISPSASSTRD